MSKAQALQPLQVWLLGDHVGELSRVRGQLIFQYSLQWRSRADAVPMSHSLPVREAAFIAGAVKSFFCWPVTRGVDAATDFAAISSV